MSPILIHIPCISSTSDSGYSLDCLPSSIRPTSSSFSPSVLTLGRPVLPLLSSALLRPYFLRQHLHLLFFSSTLLRHLRGHPVSHTLIDLSSGGGRTHGDPHNLNGGIPTQPPCGACEFCVREAAILSASNAAAAAAAGLSDPHSHHHHHVCVQDLEEAAALTAAGLTGSTSGRGTLSRHHHNNPYGTLGRQPNVTFAADPTTTTLDQLDSGSGVLMRPNSRLTSPVNDIKHNSIRNTQHSRIRVPLTVCFLIMLTYVILGGLMFSRWNPRWSLLDGSFFSFNSLTTVGQPASSSSSEAILPPHGSLFQGSNKRLIVYALYLLIGYALMSMSLHLVHEDVVKRVRRIGKWLSTCFCGRKDKESSHNNVNEMDQMRTHYDPEMEGS